MEREGGRERGRREIRKEWRKGGRTRNERGSKRNQLHLLLQVYSAYFFSKIEHILVQKAALNTSQKVQVTQSMFSDNCAIKLEINKQINKRYNKTHGIKKYSFK